MSELRKKLEGWHIADLSVIAIYESVHELGLLDKLDLSQEQHLHGLALVMALWLIGKSVWTKSQQA